MRKQNTRPTPRLEALHLLMVISVLTLLSFAVLPMAKASSGLTTVKSNVLAGTGSCLPKPFHLVEVLRRNNITYAGNTNSEKLKALSKIMNAIDNIGDGRFTYHKGAKYKFFGESGVSRYNGKYLEIRGGPEDIGVFHSQFCKSGRCHSTDGENNLAMLVHELGHYIGHQKINKQHSNFKGTVYKAYASHMKDKQCNVSRYATDKVRGNHEEFAEAFAAYVANPELLKSASCEPAVNFFQNLFGEIQTPTTCLERLASIENRPTKTAQYKVTQ